MIKNKNNEDVITMLKDYVDENYNEFSNLSDSEVIEMSADEFLDEVVDYLKENYRFDYNDICVYYVEDEDEIWVECMMQCEEVFGKSKIRCYIYIMIKDKKEKKSYDFVKSIIESYDDEEILNEFLDEFEEGKEISYEYYYNFCYNLIDDMSETYYINCNWNDEYEYV